MHDSASFESTHPTPLAKTGINGVNTSRDVQAPTDRMYPGSRPLSVRANKGPLVVPKPRLPIEVSNVSDLGAYAFVCWNSCSCLPSVLLQIRRFISKALLGVDLRNGYESRPLSLGS